MTTMTLAEYRQMGKETIEKLYKEQGIDVEVMFGTRNATIFTPGRKEHFSITHYFEDDGKFVFEVQTTSLGEVDPMADTAEASLMRIMGILFTNRAFTTHLRVVLSKIDYEFAL